MKVTAALKKELSDWLDTYWTTYLKGDIETWATFIRDDYRNIGGTKEEIWNSKQEIINYTNSIMDQMLGTVDIRNRKVELIPYGEYMMVHEFTDLYVKVEGEWIFYGPFRMSSLLEKTDSGWIALHQHGSYPDMKAMEGEAFSIDALKAENAKLQAAVKSRTLELEQNNRELEIEAATERVRVQSMAMQHPDDLDKVNKEILNQLNQLQIPGLTGVTFYLINENGWVNAWDFSSPGNIGAPNSYTLQFDSNKYEMMGEPFRVFGQSDKDYYVADYTFEKLEQAATELEEINPTVATVFKEALANGKLTHQWSACARIANGLLGIDLVNPPSEDTKTIVLKMAGAFNQAYQRFLDLQNAAAQAREAKIEAALERTRTQSMIMQHSKELDDTLRVFHEQVLLLGIPSAFSFLWLPDEKNDRHVFWAAWGEKINGLTLFKSKAINYPLDRNEPATAQCLLDWKSNEPVYSYHVPPAAVENYFAVWQELIDGVDHLQPEYFSGGLHYVEAFMKYGCFGVMVVNDLTEDEKKLLSRFANEFERTYTRFLDLQKAEAQAREAQIQLALERVRARAMAMQHSNELSDTARLLFQQIKALGVPPWSCGFNIWEKGDTVFTSYMGSPEGVILEGLKIPLMEEAAFIHFHESRERGDELFIDILEGSALEEHYHYLLSLPEIKEAFEKRAQVGEHRPTFQINHLANFSHGNLMFITYQPCPEAHNIFIRFAKVFEQTYTRFLDLQKAEAQAKEAQIETALERVRSRSMGMQKSEELKEVIKIIYQQLKHLNIHLDHAGFVIDYKPKGDWHFWIADEQDIPSEITHPYFDSVWAKQFNEAKEKGTHFFATHLNFEEKNKFYKELLSYVPGLPEASKDFYLNCPGLAAATVLSEDVGLYIENFSGIPYTDDENNTLLRFGKVFQQTYTRFLDLQKAEAQAREAKIEAALEKARARTMAMQSSEELPEVANVLFLEVQGLGIPAWSCGYNILAEDKTTATCCMSSEGTLQTPFQLRLFGEASFAEMGDFIRSEQTMLVQELGGNALEEHYAFMKSFPDLKPTFDQIDELGLSLPTYQINHLCKFTQGFLLFITYEKVPESHNIFKRFTKVFEQTYTRFLDLKKAEAQAREAQINLAVERVRARALAMFQSEEILYVVNKLKEEIMSLDIPNVIAATIHLKENDGRCRIWDITSIEVNDEALHHPMDIRFRLEDTDPTFFMRRIWGNTANYFVEMQDEHDLQCTIQWLRDIDRNQQADETEEFIASTNLKQLYHPTIQLNNGRMGIDLLEKPAPEIESILKKMGAAFDLAYTRFLDLQKAETQARQAKIETALEKVRARALAMQEPEELTEVAEVLRHEMGLLGVEELETCSIFIHDETMNRTECWYALKDSRSEEKKLVSDHFPLQLHNTWVGREMETFYNSDSKQISIVMQGANRKEWINYCEEQSISLQGYYGEHIPDRTYHLYKFSHGAIGAASAGDISAESWDLLQRAASVFSLAYSRFKDLTQARFDLQRLKEEKQKAETALSELQTTQKQLIQSEKMASLGELTAGIAHEIQNPLNFVNNFSEVSKEMLDEMREAFEKGDTEEAKEIMNDVIQNLEKINHHGKRADGIVKGMLQHSRTSSGTKEPTDIDALADEYLRLAYHGLRAKDKLFNATMKTDFDESIGNINIIPQDIGRVILNLITNAFYVVNEKSKQNIAGYEPTVEISTKKVYDKVEVKVKDNGNGIPEKVLDKIFQPFFTTKPTGQGTGLGLSLSYDIVKAHDGELKVETKEGEGSTFTILLPTN